MLAVLIQLLQTVLWTWFFGSFVEWAIHKYGMHDDKISKVAHYRHAVKHHDERRSLRNFFFPKVPEGEYRLFKSSAVPYFAVPFILLSIAVGYFSTSVVGWGLAIGTNLYIVAYEFVHYYIHHYEGYWFQRTRLFYFLAEWHRVHHHRAKKNYGVVLPIADFILGTWSLDTLAPEQPAPKGMPPLTGPLSAIFYRREAARSGP